MNQIRFDSFQTFLHCKFCSRDFILIQLEISQIVTCLQKNGNNLWNLWMPFQHLLKLRNKLTSTSCGFIEWREQL